MQSQGSTSSQPSFDSLSSSDSLFLSDSEQAEDDADVFLTDSSPSVIIVGGGRAAADAHAGSESPGSQWACDGFTDKEEEEGSDRSGSGSKVTSVGARHAEPAGQSTKSQGDLVFAQKCAELQGFVRPLLELLNGLKRGRFDRGLSSFQQSVAMDRIQRIVGVLQRPNIGEKYLNILLQVEMMLKLWFPQIIACSAAAASSAATSPAIQHTSTSTPSHKHRDQSHIPVKKRRLSWTGTDSATPSPALKCPRLNQEEKKKEQVDDKRQSPLSVASEAPKAKNPLKEHIKGKDSDNEDKDKPSKYKAGQTSEPSLTWVHVAPILSPRKACSSHEGTAATGTAATGTAATGTAATGTAATDTAATDTAATDTAATGDSEKQHVVAVFPPRISCCSATQDCSITSTTATCKHHKNLKKPIIPCQSQPAAEPPTDGDTSETCGDQSKSPQVTLEPLPRVCPTPVET
ncbi:uncharacterized protein LOC143003895 [Genypterus blacodes]|uniref:uncharacterized protein LOC143003895 n=1 Tax=Genypterus blacodes TaxID=154954 RepID=UPI003F762AA0